MLKAKNTSFLNEKELTDWLRKFWFGARKADEELYTVNSLKSFKYGLNRLLTGADPGFPVGGRQPSLEGAPTSDTGAFW